MGYGNRLQPVEKLVSSENILNITYTTIDCVRAQIPPLTVRFKKYTRLLVLKLQEVVNLYFFFINVSIWCGVCCSH